MKFDWLLFQVAARDDFTWKSDRIFSPSSEISPEISGKKQKILQDLEKHVTKPLLPLSRSSSASNIPVVAPVQKIPQKILSVPPPSYPEDDEEESDLNIEIVQEKFQQNKNQNSQIHNSTNSNNSINNSNHITSSNNNNNNNISNGINSNHINNNKNIPDLEISSKIPAINVNKEEETKDSPTTMTDNDEANDLLSKAELLLLDNKVYEFDFLTPMENENGNETDNTSVDYSNMLSDEALLDDDGFEKQLLDIVKMTADEISELLKEGEQMM